MRAILIDWLVDVHLKFKLMPETLYLTTNLIDRFLETKQVTRKHLQLVSFLLYYLITTCLQKKVPPLTFFLTLFL